MRYIASASGFSFTSRFMIHSVNNVFFSILKLFGFSVVPVLNGTVITGYSRIDFSGFTALRTVIYFSGYIAVRPAYRVRRRQRIIREPVIVRYLLNEICGSLPVGELFSEECMEYSAGSVKSLKFILNVKRFKDIIGKSNRQMRRVRIIRCFTLLARSYYIRIPLNIVFSKTV